MNGEAEFIEGLRALATTPGARGLNDDAAVLTLGGETIVVTHDTMVEGVHWLAGQDPRDVAFKLVTVNLSDLAAKGCEPVGVMLSYMLGDAAWNAAFTEGLGEALAQYRCPLLGGDTVAGGAAARTLGMTAFGRPVRIPAPARADAMPGQALHVTGTLGAALAGFEAMQRGSKDDALTAAYRRPTALIEQGRAIARLAGAMMDVSDGLLLDALRMAEASGTTIAIDSAAVPVCPPLADRRCEALRWGDDYQLLFTLDAGIEAPVPATVIGQVQPRGAHPLLIDGAAAGPGATLGYAHRRD